MAVVAGDGDKLDDVDVGFVGFVGFASGRAKRFNVV